MDSETTAAAARLCMACGMCCDGTMFQTVHMQPGDSAAQLATLGMRIDSRADGFVMAQPCAALVEQCCIIYAQRPVRCRLFHCQQLLRLSRHEVEEASVQALITDTRALAAEARSLIEQLGGETCVSSLNQAYEAVSGSPASALSPHLLAARQHLDVVMRKLRLIINREFRPPPGSD